MGVRKFGFRAVSDYYRRGKLHFGLHSAWRMRQHSVLGWAMSNPNYKRIRWQSVAMFIIVAPLIILTGLWFEVVGDWVQMRQRWF